jgi:hypothetical protein
MTTPLLLAAFLTVAAAAQAPQGGTIIERHQFALENLGKKDASGGWLVSDEAVALLKQDLGKILGAEPAMLTLWVHPKTNSGLMGGVILGTRKDEPSVFVVGGKDQKITAEYRNVTFAGLYKDGSGKEKHIIGLYNDGYKAYVGVDACTGRLDVSRDGGSIDSVINGPEGEMISIRREAGKGNNYLSINGGEFSPVFK